MITGVVVIVLFTLFVLNFDSCMEAFGLVVLAVLLYLGAAEIGLFPILGLFGVFALLFFVYIVFIKKD